MEISKKLNGQTFSVPTLFAVDTHVSRSQRRAKDKAKTTPATYGLGLENVLAFLDPVTRSWKMYAATCLLAELPSLEKLPNSGIARNGVLYPRPPWEPLTAETELLLWPTPTTQEVEHPNAIWTQEGKSYRREPKNGGRGHSMGLADAVQKWPTPQARDYKGPSGRSIKGLERDLPMAVGSGGKLNPTWVEWLMGFPAGWTDLSV
jgi:hypothetical protein